MKGELNMYNNIFGKDYVNISKEDLDALKYSCLDESTKMINYINPIIKKNQEKTDNQIRVIENIAKNTQTQADSLSYQIKLMEEQLNFTKKESANAKKGALISNIISIISLLVAIASLISNITS